MKKFSIIVLAFFSIILGCKEPPEEGPNITGGGNGDTGSLVATMEFAGMNKALMAPAFGVTQADVASITLAVSWDDGSKEPVSCIKAKTTPAKWKCEVLKLPVDKLLKLAASAKNIGGDEIYKGGGEVTLAAGETKQVSLLMSPVCPPDSCPPPCAPIIKLIAAPASLTVGYSGVIDIQVLDCDGDNVSVKFTSSLGGSFDPDSGNVKPAAGSPASLSTKFTAGSESGMDSITITVEDGTGLSSSRTIEIDIKKAGNIDGNVNLPPDITAIKGDTSGAKTTFTATVTDEDGDPNTISYSWFIDDTAAGSTESITVDTPEVGAEIKVTVTDGGGASRSYSIIWGDNGAPKDTTIIKTWDMGKEYSKTSNPNGVWSYGWRTEPTGDGFALSSYIYQNTFWLRGYGIWSPSIQPGPLLWSSNNVDGFPVVRWTCPANGNYKIETTFTGADSRGDDDLVWVVIGGTPVFSGEVHGYGNSTSYNNTTVLQAGDYVDFVVKWDDRVSYYDGSWIRLSGIISEVSST